MPLSEHEQRMLDELEQSLSAEDPKFASSMRSSGGAPQRKGLLLAGLGMAAGLAVAVGGVMAGQVWLGVVGFVIMVAVGAWAFNSMEKPHGHLGSVQEDGSVRARKAPRAGRAQHRRPKQASSGSFMQRLEQRWERRRREQGW